MKSKKINDSAVWLDMLRNPEDYRKAIGYAFISVGCFVGIVAIRILV